MSLKEATSHEFLITGEEIKTQNSSVAIRIDRRGDSCHYVDHTLTFTTVLDKGVKPATPIEALIQRALAKIGNQLIERFGHLRHLAPLQVLNSHGSGETLNLARTDAIDSALNSYLNKHLFGKITWFEQPIGSPIGVVGTRSCN